MEAWWKHEGKNRCAILTIRAQATHPDPARNWRKARKNSGYYAIVHGSFDTTHNLKVVGSNPTPATIFIKLDQPLKSRPPGWRLRFILVQAYPEKIGAV